MNIEQCLLTRNQFSRPGAALHTVKGIVVHWVGGAGQHAISVYRYFESLKSQNTKDAVYASAQFVVGLYGEILQVIPENEMAYHVGALKYTELAMEKLGAYPNNCTIGIELCHPDDTGVFRQETIGSALWLAGFLLGKYGLTPKDVYRHFDVTGKICPRSFVENADAWHDFVAALSA